MLAGLSFAVVLSVFYRSWCHQIRPIGVVKTACNTIVSLQAFYWRLLILSDHLELVNMLCIDYRDTPSFSFSMFRLEKEKVLCLTV